MTDQQELTPDEIYFTNAFNAHRGCLAAFANCQNREELHVIRDGFLLALASDLCPTEYEPVRNRIILDPRVAAASDETDVFTRTVESARKSPAWEGLIRATKAKAFEVNSDLDEIWMTLERGRLEWLGAASSAHRIKTTLQSALNNQCGGAPTEGDASDAKMVWMYAISLSIPQLAKEREAWQKAVNMTDPTRPLVGYKAELWDARKDEWRCLDLGVQAAAERGGSSIEEAWKAS